MVDSLPHHVRALGRRPRRRYFPMERGINAGASATKERDNFLELYPVVRQWFRLLAERLNSIAVLYHVAAMIAEVDPREEPVRVDLYRQGPYDMLLTLSGGRSVGIMRQSPVLPSLNLRFRLRTMEQLDPERKPLVTLVLTHSDQATRRAIRTLGDPWEHPMIFVAPEEALLAGDARSTVWQQCGQVSGLSLAVKIYPDCALPSIVAGLDTRVAASCLHRGRKNIPNPDALYSPDVRIDMPDPRRQLEPSFAVTACRSPRSP